MQALSRVLIGLYEAADHASVQDYPGEALRLIRSLIAFDDGMLGSGMAQAEGTSDPVLKQVHVPQREHAFHVAYALLSAQGCATYPPAQPMDEPLTWDCRDVYRQRHAPEFAAFCQRHAMLHLMLFAGPASGQPGARWIALCRGFDKAFDALEKCYLAAVWPHLLRALQINRERYLDAQLGIDTQRAAALFNRYGVIEAEHAGFRQALAMEWPGFDGNRIPHPVHEAWEQGSNVYAGLQVRLSLRRMGELVMCRAAPAAMPETLTQAERIVAARFASGLSHKAIAEQLGISQHTVRSHIAHIYTKLDVHDKAALANLLTMQAGRW